MPPAGRGGFAFWEGFEGGFLLNDPWLHGTRLPEPTRFAGYQSDVVCRRAAEWFRAAEERPRFAVVSLEAPHPPYDAPAAGVHPRDPREIVLQANVPRGGDVEARARRELAGYHAHLEATDRAIGGLIDAVDAAGARSTIIVFTSVHGDMHGAHGLFRKGWPYEESVRVPLLVRGWSALSPTRSPAAGGEAPSSERCARLAARPAPVDPRVGGFVRERFVAASGTPIDFHAERGAAAAAVRSGVAWRAHADPQARAQR